MQVSMTNAVLTRSATKRAGFFFFFLNYDTDFYFNENVHRFVMKGPGTFGEKERENRKREK